MRNHEWNDGAGISARVDERQALLRKFFAERIENRTTQQFLRNSEGAALIGALVSGSIEAEAEAIRRRLRRPPANAQHPASAEKLRVALTNHGLCNYAGSELWTFDIARYLLRHGCDIRVFSPKLGGLAEAMQAAGVPVTSCAEDIARFAPHILHVQHYPVMRPLVERLSGSPAKMVNMCHGPLPALELPMPSGAHKYLTASIASKVKVHLLTGATWNDIHISPNFFDETRFVGEGRADRGGKALLFSSKTTAAQRTALTGALKHFGYSLDHTGYGGIPVTAPEHILPAYDLVFAVGRSAIEALASGCKVALWDDGILGPAVSPANFWRCVAANFAFPAQALPYCFLSDPDPRLWFEQHIFSLTGEDAAEVSSRTRKYLSLENIGPHLLAHYADVMKGRASNGRVVGLLRRLAS
jgi:hypothetical protein